MSAAGLSVNPKPLALDFVRIRLSLDYHIAKITITVPMPIQNRSQAIIMMIVRQSKAARVIIVLQLHEIVRHINRGYNYGIVRRAQKSPLGRTHVQG